MIKYYFSGTGRELSKIIKSILYQNLANEIIKQNYITKYKKIEGKVIKENIKIITFIGHNEKLLKFLEKNKKFELCEK